MNRTDLDKLREELCKLDCGDNSCYFAVKREGMRTNGGCRCLENNPKGVERYARRSRQYIEARDRLDLVAPEVVAMREAIELALIYEPYVDKYKIKHTAYPKLIEAMRDYDRAREKK